MQLGVLMFALMLTLMAFRVHIAVAMLVVGVIGYVSLVGWLPLLAHLKTAPYARFSNYDLSVIPLYLLMGAFAARGGLSKSLFDAASAFMGHWRGGLAISAVGACAGFGAICGSSLATAATMGRVALPELRRHGYSPQLATGTLAAGGTLGILIPPSVPLVIYAMLAEQNIAKLYAAAIVPGIIAMVGYMITIAIVTRLKPGSGPAAERAAAAHLAALCAAQHAGHGGHRAGGHRRDSLRGQLRRGVAGRHGAGVSDGDAASHAVGRRHGRRRVVGGEPGLRCR